MTPDKAAELLATYELTGGRVNETARQLGLAKSTVSEHLKKANIIPAGSRQSPRKIDWAKAWGSSESMTLTLIKEKAPAARFRDLAIYAGIASDKRYREEHPESVRGVNINSGGGPVQVIFDV